jgi:hypothetical protein
VCGETLQDARRGVSVDVGYANRLRRTAVHNTGKTQVWVRDSRRASLDGGAGTARLPFRESTFITRPRAAAGSILSTRVPPCLWRALSQQKGWTTIANLIAAR